MSAIRTFVLGMREFRLGATTHFDWPEIETYDRGRSLAHRLTLGLYEDFAPEHSIVNRLGRKWL